MNQSLFPSFGSISSYETIVLPSLGFDSFLHVWLKCVTVGSDCYHSQLYDQIVYFTQNVHLFAL